MLTGSLNARRRIVRPCVPGGVSVGHVRSTRFGGAETLIVTAAEGCRMKCRLRVRRIDRGLVGECGLLRSSGAGEEMASARAGNCAFWRLRRRVAIGDFPLIVSRAIHP
jgi:hypothetical protein